MTLKLKSVLAQSKKYFTLVLFGEREKKRRKYLACRECEEICEAFFFIYAKGIAVCFKAKTPSVLETVRLMIIWNAECLSEFKLRRTKGKSRMYVIMRKAKLCL
jgi:hypothetical protein